MDRIIYNLFKHLLMGYVKLSELTKKISERIEDNLESTAADKALSARQGKKLKESIDAIVVSGGGDMLSTDYDEDGDGIIDRAKSDGNGRVISETYATKEETAECDKKINAVQDNLSQHKHNASDITSGTLPIARGGTGAVTAEDGRKKLGAAPAYTYGTADKTAGESALATGTLYFVYE